MAVGSLGRSLYFLVAGIWISHADVFPNGFVKEKIVLGHIADLTHELSKWDAANILPAKVDRTGGYIPKTGHQLGNRRLPGAGWTLSGGERQRITIARAMLKQASVIILDEATAYADPENEALIQQAISKLVVGKSLIVVAHRLNTIRNADQILVVANGEIVGRGIQEELLANCPLYRKMWQDYAGSTEGGTEDV